MKKLLSVFLCLVIIFPLSTSALAAEPEMTLEQTVEFTALSFMQKSLDESIEISETTPFYDLENNITAYHITFRLHDTPAGYVLISLLHPETPIVEFAFEGSGLVETILKRQTNIDTRSSPTNKIYFLGDGELYISYPNASFQNVYTAQTVTTQKLTEYYQEILSSSPMPINSVDIRAGILDWAKARIDQKSIVKIPNFGVGTDYWLLEDFDETGNVCAPTCATNILWYWGIQRGYHWVVQVGTQSGKTLATSIFNTMSSYMKTVPSLGTADFMIPRAYKEFMGYRGSNFTLTSLTQNKYSDFTSAVDAGLPVHTMLRNTSAHSVGHDVMTLGYGKSTNGTQYLFVMDGWEDYGRFVIFNYYPIIKGISVEVGPTSK